MEEYELIERENTINNKAYWRASNKKEDIEINFLFNEDLNILKSYEGYTNQIINYKTMRIYGLPESVISSNLLAAAGIIIKKDIRKIYNELNKFYAKELPYVSVGILIFQFYYVLIMTKKEYYRAFFILWCFEQTKHFKKYKEDIRNNWEILKEKDFIPYLKWIEKDGEDYKINLKKSNDYVEVLHKIKKYFMPEKSIEDLFNSINDVRIEKKTFNLFLYLTLLLSTLVFMPVPNISILWHNIAPTRKDDVDIYKKYLPEVSRILPPPVPIIGYISDSKFNTDYDNQHNEDIVNLKKKNISFMFAMEFTDRLIKYSKKEDTESEVDPEDPLVHLMVGNFTGIFNEEIYINEMKKLLSQMPSLMPLKNDRKKKAE